MSLQRHKKLLWLRLICLATGAAGEAIRKSGAATLANLAVYNPGGTDVALADGGSGDSLVDPNANTLVGWDDTDGAVKFFTLGSNLSYDHATIR